MVSGLDSESRKLSESIYGYWTELSEQSDEILGGNLEIGLFFYLWGSSDTLSCFMQGRPGEALAGWVTCLELYSIQTLTTYLCNS